MQLKGKLFNGSNALLHTDRHIRSIAGIVISFPEFQLRSVPVKEIMEVLLLHLYAHNICCHLGGPFGTYMAQIFNSYQIIWLYVALNDSPLQNLLFQVAGEAEYFKLEGFQFTLLEHDVVYGIDSVDPCRPESNIDFVHFMWDNSENFSFLRHSITLLPHDPSCSQPQMLYLTHHRAESDGWNHLSGCAVCESDLRSGLYPLTYYCKSPDSFICFVC